MKRRKNTDKEAREESIEETLKESQANDNHSQDDPIGEHYAGSENTNAPNPDGGDQEDVTEALREALEELDRHREAMLRMQAEVDNQRKRMAREAEKTRKFALERVMKDLLQVHDSLERGIGVGDESVTVESLREGQALTLKMLAKVLKDHGLEIVDPQGESFNPEFHEAMTMVPSPDHAENTVMEVLQKGFRLHDRLIRPAMVVVSRKPD